MRFVLAAAVACLVAAQPAAARADEPPSPIVSQQEIPRTSAIVAPPTSAEADDLYRSGRHRLGAGIALLVVGVLGWGVSTAGTVVSIVGYVKDWRNECANGACSTLKTTGQWLSIGGTIAEVGGIAGGIPLVISGVHRLHAARRMRIGLAASPNGAAVAVGTNF